MREGPSAQEQVRELYAKTEAAAATATERMVQSDSFGELLSKVTENTMAVTRIGFDAMDLIVRNLRLAGRQDVTRLARQLARTEDKLEMVLQEVESLRAELDQAREDGLKLSTNGSPAGSGSNRGRGASGGRRAASSSRGANARTPNGKGERARHP